MNKDIIEAKGLTKTYHLGREDIVALNEASFSIPQGGFIAIVGPSGSGKTTLLNLLGCLDIPTSGSLKLDGTEVGGLKERELVKLRRENVGFVFQQFFLLPTLTVRENIELPLLFNRRNGNESRIDAILGTVGLEARAGHLPNQLSGGEMQRVAIGRALINQPKMLLADEPTGNLDSTTASRIYELFRKLNSQGITLVVVTHNAELAKIADRIIHLKDGSII